MTAPQNDFKWAIDELICFRGVLHVTGWAFHDRWPICELGCRFAGGEYRPVEGYGLASPDVENHYGERARNCRLAIQQNLESPQDALTLERVFTLQDGSSIAIDHLTPGRMLVDPFHGLQKRFYQLLRERPGCGDVLELGSRNRSGVIRRHLIPASMRYTGLDILQGENVNIVADAHGLGNVFGPERFDAIFAMSVFEHLLMPWKVVLEMNRVLKADGLVMITTHQSWPLHERPWDFWRFSDQSWRALFNAYTGFEIIETAMGEPASIVSHMLNPTTIGLDRQPAYLGSALLCKKVGDTKLAWNVDVADIVDTMYPQHATALR